MQKRQKQDTGNKQHDREGEADSGHVGLNRAERSDDTLAEFVMRTSTVRERAKAAIDEDGPWSTAADLERCTLFYCSVDLAASILCEFACFAHCISPSSQSTPHICCNYVQLFVYSIALTCVVMPAARIFDPLSLLHMSICSADSQACPTVDPCHETGCCTFVIAYISNIPVHHCFLCTTSVWLKAKLQACCLLHHPFHFHSMCASGSTVDLAASCQGQATFTGKMIPACDSKYALSGTQ